MKPSTTIRQFPDDCLPPEDEYDSRESVHTAINAWAAPRGYAFVTGKSRKTGSGKQVVVFSCDRGGVFRKASGARQRTTTTRRTGCMFSVLAKESLDKKTWQLVHRPGTKYANHNHEPSADISVHPVHRQLSDADRVTIRELAEAGKAPREIKSYLIQHAKIIVKQQDIYNCIARGKKGRPPSPITLPSLAEVLEALGIDLVVRRSFEAESESV